MAGLKEMFEYVENLIMPVEYIDIDEPEQTKIQENRTVIKEEEQESRIKVANGEDVVVPTTTAHTYSASVQSEAAPHHITYGGRETRRPKLTVHTTKVPSFDVNVYTPKHFDQAADISNCLKAGKAAMVNFEQVDPENQCRICDFVNGSCYVLDGAVRRISETMVLDVPANVNVNEINAFPLEE